MTAVQIPFNIPVREAFNAEDYLVTASNVEAVNWIDRWPDWRGVHCTILYGTRGCGKTHLSHVWQQKTGAKYGDLTQITTADLDQMPACLVLEDVDGLLTDIEQQEMLFHLYNWQKEKGGSLLLTAAQHPKHWSLSLPDLQSRMLAAISIEIGAPDDELLAAVIVKQFTDRQITVPQEVVNYLMLRIERSFAAARDIVSRIDTLALSRQRKITVPLVRNLLDDLPENEV
ncbi:HdaA/DnaA family protein [Paremcibacter congregatus]|uniref:DNA replication protein n=1 Tax=Paremcibacter congregatus TaxID=2043170 RepID=A0A2G4YUV5_9PROT|nr:DnaA/Hda family protein [Paremcibacter congregatus]PHZ86111.1 DNA replication protein [Paremcibacter congregatus]QDE27077.1 DNA replication protein [Paremcibacter congregatus]